ncbi:hypothetical protein K8R04_01005 [Candidatus Uhrbacteria bacterium]|nr:hypothetical protein [Candidatus Uhrbacteria bacterium]
MKMKTSPNDVSNKEILLELREFKQEFKQLSTKVDRIEASQGELLEVINEFSSETDARFDRLEDRMGGLDGRMGGVENRLTRVEAGMVTKGYLDDKLADLRSDIVRYTKKEIVKALG